MIQKLLKKHIFKKVNSEKIRLKVDWQFSRPYFFIGLLEKKDLHIHGSGEVNLLNNMAKKFFFPRKTGHVVEPNYF